MVYSKRFKLNFSILILFIICSCKINSEKQKLVEQKANDFVHLWFTGEEKAARKLINKHSQNVLGEETLQSLRQDIVSQFGLYENIISAEYASGKRKPHIIVSGQFQRAQAQILIAFDVNSEIGDIRYKAVPGTEQKIKTRMFSSALIEKKISTGLTESIDYYQFISKERKENKGCVLLIPDFGPQNKNLSLGNIHPFLDIAEALALKGWTTYRFDKRNLVYKEKLNKELSYLEKFTLKQEYFEDLYAIVNKEKNQCTNWAFIAHGFGAQIIPNFIAGSSLQNSKTILLAPKFKLLEDILIDKQKLLALDLRHEKRLEEERQRIKMIRAQVNKEFPAKKLPIGLPHAYWESVTRLDNKFPENTLVMVTEKDTSWNAEEEEKLKGIFIKNEHIKRFKHLNQFLIPSHLKKELTTGNKNIRVDDELMQVIIDYLN